MIRLKGKIVRDGDCPLKKSILCEDCEFYDGWGADLVNHCVEIWCKSKNIIDGNKLELIPMRNKLKGKKKKRKKIN